MTDREKLIALLVEAESLCAAIDCYDGAVCEYAGEIGGCAAFRADHLISKGVAAVVRCAECKWFDKGGNGVAPICTRHSGLAGAHDRSFCSYGERRSE